MFSSHALNIIKEQQKNVPLNFGDNRRHIRLSWLLIAQSIGIHDITNDFLNGIIITVTKFSLKILVLVSNSLTKLIL